MKKRLLSILLTLAMLLGTASVLPMTAMAASSGYSGAIDISTVSADTDIASGSVYFISDQEDLEKFAQLCTYKNSYFAGATVVLENNIVLNNGWTASATAPAVTGAITWTPITAFRGTFDGQNFKISGLYIPQGIDYKAAVKKDVNGTAAYASGSEDASGFFALLCLGAVVQNLTIDNAYVGGDKFVGSVAGKCDTACGHGSISIYNCTSNATLDATSSPVGGIVGGSNVNKTVFDTCTFSGKITKGTNIGGILGQLWSATEIKNCINNSDITATTVLGGMVGQSGGALTITDCINNGKLIVTSNNNVGGMVGTATSAATISGCENSGVIDAKYKAGGVVGSATAALTISGCKNKATVTTSAQQVGGIVGDAVKVTITSSHNSASVKNTGGVAGGIAGKVNGAGSTIKECTNNGAVNGTGNYGVGGIVGYNNNTLTIENCTNMESGAVDGKGNGNGGIIGRTDNSLTLTNCTNQAAINGANNTGGMIGVEQSGSAATVTLTDCVNTGAIKAANGVGGMIGSQYQWGGKTEISGCKNLGNVTSTSLTGVAGGIFGSASAEVDFTNCVNLGAVTYDRQTADAAAASSSGTLGGILGSTTKTFKITNSANFGTITFETGTAKDSDTSAIGGIVGKINASGTTPTLTDCVSAGSLSAGNSAIGGIVGYQAAGTLKYTRCVFVGEVTAHVNYYFTCGFVGRMDSAGTVFNECAYSETDLRAVGKYAGSSVTIDVSGTVNGTNYSFASTTGTSAGDNLVAINNALLNAGVRLNLTDLNAIKNLSKFDWADKDNGWKLGSYNGEIIPMPVAVAKLVEEEKTEKANGVDFHGVQTKAVDTAENTFDARFVSTVDDLNREKIGFRVVVIKDDKTAATYVLEDGTVYKALNYSIDENTMGESETGTYSVDGKYLGALVFEGISATGRTVFEVTAFSVDGDAKSYDDSYIVVFKDGVFAQSYQKNEQKSF